MGLCTMAAPHRPGWSGKLESRRRRRLEYGGEERNEAVHEKDTKRIPAGKPTRANCTEPWG